MACDLANWVTGPLIGSTNGTATTYDLTDAEGSVLTSLSASAVLGEQIYGPYGNQRYSQGMMGTDKGYTGQFQDTVSGFDYYNARYYDPVMGQFLSADHVQGNAQGMDTYSYVNSNPETAIDPTGQRISCPPDCDTSGGVPTAIHPGSNARGGSTTSSPPNGMTYTHSSPLVTRSPQSAKHVASPSGSPSPCPGTSKSCGNPGVRNTGKSLLRESGAAFQNDSGGDASDVLIGIGALGLVQILDRLQDLIDSLNEGTLNELLAPNGQSIISGYLASAAGIMAVVVALIAAPETAGLTLAGGLLTAALGIASGYATAQSGSGSSDVPTSYAETITKYKEQLSDLGHAMTDNGIDIEKYAFEIQEVDTYKITGVHWISLPPTTFGGPIRREADGYNYDYNVITSATFNVTIEHIGAIPI